MALSGVAGSPRAFLHSQFIGAFSSAHTTGPQRRRVVEQHHRIVCRPKKVRASLPKAAAAAISSTALWQLVVGAAIDRSLQWGVEVAFEVQGAWFSVQRTPLI